jgi:hypothetical protein
MESSSSNAAAPVIVSDPSSLPESRGIAPRRRWDAGTIGAIALICLVRAAFRSLPQRKGTLDLVVALDGAWRVLNGQRPHVDFYSALGPLSSLSTALGLVLAHHAADGINYGTALLGFVVGIWSFLIARSRLLPVWAALAAVFCTLLMTTSVALGDPYSLLSEEMFYDRYGFALLVPILIESYLPLREGGSTFAGGVSSGVCCGLLLFLKASYFFVAAPLIVLLFVIRRPDLKRIAGLLVGLGVVVLTILGYLGFDAGAVVSDLRIAAGARTERFRAGLIMYEPLIATIPSDLGLLLLAAFAAFRSPDRRRIVVTTVLVIGAGIALLLSNYQLGAMPLNVAFAIILCDAFLANPFSRRPWFTPGSHRVFRAVCTAAALCVILPLMTTNARALAFGLRTSFLPADSPQVNLFHSAVMGKIYIMNQENNDAGYVRYANEGMELITRWTRPDASVYTLGFADPYSYLLQRRPARGGSTWLHPRYNFSDDHKPAPEWLLGGADVVMFYRIKNHFLQDYINRNYFGYVTSHFHPIAESEHWRLYGKNED